MSDVDSGVVARYGEAAIANSSLLFARWQQQFAIACFGWEFDPQISPSPVVRGVI